MSTINYVTKDGAILDQKITEGLVTTVLGTPQVDLVNGGESIIHIADNFNIRITTTYPQR